MALELWGWQRCPVPPNLPPQQMQTQACVPEPSPEEGRRPVTGLLLSSRRFQGAAVSRPLQSVWAVPAFPTSLPRGHCLRPCTSATDAGGQSYRRAWKWEKQRGGKWSAGKLEMLTARAETQGCPRPNRESSHRQLRSFLRGTVDHPRREGDCEGQVMSTV